MQIPVSLELLQTFLVVYAFVAILRAMMQYLDADFHNPISQFIHRITNLPIKMLRIVVPRVGGADMLSPLVLALLVCGAERAILIYSYIEQFNIFATAVLTVAIVLDRALTIMIIAILAHVVMSWIPMKFTGFQRLVFTFTRPILARAQGIIPTFGALDFSPILVLLGLEIISWIVVGPLEAFGARLLN